MFNLEKINFQNLLKLAKLVENKPRKHDMNSLINYCGTTSCMMGDYLIDKEGYTPGKTILTNYPWEETAQKEFGISEREVHFLFDYFYASYFPNKQLSKKSHVRNRMRETKEESLRRLRKFIYYKLHKYEILADLEKAREQEGNWDVCGKVLEEINI